MGYTALDELTTGNYNTALGYEALHQIDGGEEHMTAVGYQAGASCDGSTTSTIIGASSSTNAAGVDNETVIGYGVTGAGGSNTITLGNANVTAVYMASDSGATVHCLDVKPTGGVLKENLLTNSGFDVWSNSTLVEATSGAAPVLDGANAALVNNLVTNGGFDSATTGWTAGASATLSSEGSGKTGNCLKILENGGANPNAGITVTTVVGKLYQFNCYVNSGGSEASFQVNIGDSGIGSYNNYDSETQEASADWTSMVINVVFEATGTSTSIRLRQVAGSGSGTFVLFDSVTLYEVTPGCVAADAKAMDGWWKTASAIDVLREHDGTKTKDGSFYSCKITGNGLELGWSGGTSSNTEPTWLAKVQGRTLTFGVWAWADTASQTRIYFRDSVTGYTYSSYHSGGSGWEWIELTGNVASAATFAYVAIEGGTEAAYISQPMLVFGNSIGEGNYTRPQGEVVNCESFITTISNDSPAAADDKILNLEAISSGKIPKGCKSIYMSAQALNSSITSDQGIQWGTSSANATSLRCNPVVNNVYQSESGMVECDSNGDIYQLVKEAGATMSGVYCHVTQVHLR